MVATNVEMPWSEWMAEARISMAMARALWSEDSRETSRIGCNEQTVALVDGQDGDKDRRLGRKKEGRKGQRGQRGRMREPPTILGDRQR